MTDVTEGKSEKAAPLDVTEVELQLLRHARGLGLAATPWAGPLLEELWSRGLVWRDDEEPYTYRTVDDVARALDVEEKEDGDGDD